MFGERICSRISSAAVPVWTKLFPPCFDDLPDVAYMLHGSRFQVLLGFSIVGFARYFAVQFVDHHAFATIARSPPAIPRNRPLLAWAKLASVARHHANGDPAHAKRHNPLNGDLAHFRCRKLMTSFTNKSLELKNVRERALARYL